MEADTLHADPVAEPDDALAADPEESASGPTTDALSPNLEAQMNALLRGEIDRVQPRSASKPGDADDEDTGDAADGASALSGDVKPSDQPGTGRRGAAAEIARLKAENARLQQAYETVNPPPPDASEEARKAAVTLEQRYRRLAAKPWDDPDWTAEDVDFFQTEQKRRAVAPELAVQYQAALDHDRQLHQQAYEAKHQGFEAYVLDGMAAVKGLPGVDWDAIKAAPDFRAREQLIYRAGQASAEAEQRALREENAELRRDLLTSTRAPVGAGRSSPGRAADPDTVMNVLLRGGRA